MEVPATTEQFIGRKIPMVDAPCRNGDTSRYFADSHLAQDKEDMDIIRARLKVAEALAKELRHGNAHD
jgi:hypothetical protein